MNIDDFGLVATVPLDVHCYGKKPVNRSLRFAGAFTNY